MGMSGLENPFPRFALSAHGGVASGRDTNPQVMRALMTREKDKIAQVWNVTGEGGGQPGDE